MHFFLFRAYKYTEVIFVNDMTPMLILLLLTNRNGFNNIKNAIEVADGFSSKISNMTNMFSMLPKLTGMFNAVNTQSNNENNYVDTLKNFADILK